MKCFTFLSATLGLALILHSGPVQAAFRAYFSAGVDARVAQHTYRFQEGASRRFGLNLEQKLTFNSNWSAVISGQNWYETIYADPKYPEILRSEDSQELRLNDTLVQYKDDYFRMQVGWQQIVWGETFGSFYADIVNPKDLREGVPSNLSKIRIATPAVNLRYIYKRFAFQALYLPQPHLNVLPLPGSDYFPTDLAKRASFRQIIIHRERKVPWQLEYGEFGGRVSQTLGNFDLSLLYLNYLDRNPYYRVGSGTSFPDVLILDESHSRVDTFGGSLAADLDGYVLRGEAVYTRSKLVPEVRGNTIVTTPTEETAYAASLDFPTWQRMNFSLQYSASHLMRPGDYLLRTTDITYVSLRVHGTVLQNSTLELISTLSTGGEMSSRNQLEFTHPVSNVTELKLGVESYLGSNPTEFGKLARANRAYVSLSAQFNGI